jgi:tryptophan 2,3-dioxygenase
VEPVEAMEHDRWDRRDTPGIDGVHCLHRRTDVEAFLSAWTTVFQLFFIIIDPKYTVIAYAIVAGDVVDQQIRVLSTMTPRTLKVRVGGGLT